MIFLRLSIQYNQILCHHMRSLLSVIVLFMLVYIYRKSARKPMVFRPWDEWRHESSTYILAKNIVFQ